MATRSPATEGTLTFYTHGRKDQTGRLRISKIIRVGSILGEFAQKKAIAMIVKDGTAHSIESYPIDGARMGQRVDHYCRKKSRQRKTTSFQLTPELLGEKRVLGTIDKLSTKTRRVTCRSG